MGGPGLYPFAIVRVGAGAVENGPAASGAGAVEQEQEGRVIQTIISRILIKETHQEALIISMEVVAQ